MLLLEAAPHHQGLNSSLPEPRCTEGQILPAALEEQALPLQTLLSMITKDDPGTSLSTRTAFPDTQPTSPLQPSSKYISWHKIWHCCPYQDLWIEKDRLGNSAVQHASKTDVFERTKHKNPYVKF